MTDPTPADLPRLLVVSDVNAERTGGGALVLYRLLQTYPPDRLRVVSRPTGGWPPPPARLPDVVYRDVEYRIPRLIFNRFNPFWPAVMARYVTRMAPGVQRWAAGFAPQAVLSVAHDYLWFVAAAVARKFRVPLHLILHDDWPYLQTGAPAVWGRAAGLRATERTVRRAFRRADGLYAVSPGMADRYRSEYGVRCRVLYPSRGEDSPSPAVRVRPDPGVPQVVAYAGLIHTHGTAVMLRGAAGVLAAAGGRLDLYVPYSDARLAEWGLTGPAVRRVGFFSAREMADRVAGSAHALLLPAGFDPVARRDVSTLFPSKLADYTAIGLPIVVWGPGYSSAARWAGENPGAAVLVTDPEAAALAGPFARLAADPRYACQLAGGAVRAGVRDFDPQAVRAAFTAGLLTTDHPAGVGEWQKDEI